MSFHICDDFPGPGYWERDNSHFPLPMSRHLWELFLPVYDEGTRKGLRRYGSIIDHFDFARIKGRLYLKTCYVQDAEELQARSTAAEHALATKLWRRDREEWRILRKEFRRRLIQFSQIEPRRLDCASLYKHLVSLRNIFIEGTLRHFVQQPSSMFPVGDWVLRTCEWTGATPSQALWLLKGSHTGWADFFEHPDRFDEYADRIITGFDIVDLTLRELPQLTTGVRPAPVRAAAASDAAREVANAEAGLREIAPPERRVDFDQGLAEAKVSYGLHDEDVRITYLWPLGLIRRAVLSAGERLMDRGVIEKTEHIFQTTPAELDALLSGASSPEAAELARRDEQLRSWRHEKLPPSFGQKQIVRWDNSPAACRRVNAAIMFYLGQMEDHPGAAPSKPSWSVMIAGLPASPGLYEGWARVIHDAADFRKLNQGDVLVVHTTSPAYNVILPTIGAVVTDRGGALCHCAIVAREFGIPAVVGTDHATSKIPDGARILVDGDRGFVAVLS